MVDFKKLSKAAAKKEKSNNFEEAALLWLSAHDLSKKNENRNWAYCRALTCFRLNKLSLKQLPSCYKN